MAERAVAAARGLCGRLITASGDYAIGPGLFHLWDNRQMMHRGRRYDESQPRDLRRPRGAGDAPTVAPVDAA